MQTTVVDRDQPLTKDEWTELSGKKENLAEKRLNVNLRWMGFTNEQSGKQLRDENVCVYLCVFDFLLKKMIVVILFQGMIYRQLLESLYQMIIKLFGQCMKN